MVVKTALGNDIVKFSFPTEAPCDDDEAIASLGLGHIAELVPTLDLKSPQILGIHFSSVADRFILSFDKGMGKTVIFLGAAAYQWPGKKTILLTSKNAMLAARRDMLAHFPQLADHFVFVKGTQQQRAAAWNSDARVYLMTPAAFLADIGRRARSKRLEGLPSWVEDTPQIIVDEFHKFLRSQKSETYKAIKALDPSRLLLSSGSTKGKGPQSLYAALSLCDPLRFRSYWAYINKHCITSKGIFGLEIKGVKDIHAWRKAVSHVVIHRLKDRKHYPPKQRMALDVELEPWQQKIHDDLRKELMAITDNGNMLVSPNTLANTIKLRHLLICPRFLDADLGYGAGLEGILEDVKDSELSHWVVTVPLTGPIPLIEEFFQKEGYHTERLMGGDGCDADEIERRIRRWTTRGGPMIQSTKFAESYELPAANNMYMLGADYDPEVNAQAEDRINRDIRVTPKPSNIWYVRTLNTYDTELMTAMSSTADLGYAMMDKPLKDIFNLSHER